MTFPTPLPGRIVIVPAKLDAYKSLERFHYRPGRPSTLADIVAAWHQLPHVRPRCVAVGVLSWPTACQRTRQRVLGLEGFTYGQKLRFVNANLRTISRVIVHPTFRSAGLSTAIVRALILRCPTRYIEASAMMARASPLFDRAGMRRFEPADAAQPVYFLFDKWLDRLPIIALSPARDLPLREQLVQRPCSGGQCGVERRGRITAAPQLSRTTCPDDRVAAPDIASQIHQTQEG